MTINPDKCVACRNCTYVCPMGAIYINAVRTILLRGCALHSSPAFSCGRANHPPLLVFFRLQCANQDHAAEVAKFANARPDHQALETRAPLLRTPSFPHMSRRAGSAAGYRPARNRTMI
jgi:Fe-S-cluster-containing hydrogenase component 2